MRRKWNILNYWVCSWADLLDGITGILSLGLVRPHFSYDIHMVILKKKRRNHIEKHYMRHTEQWLWKCDGIV